MPKTRSLLLAATLLSLPTALLAAGLEEASEYVSAQQALADGLPGVAAVKAGRLLKLKGWTRVETRQLATFAAEAWTRANEGTHVLTLADTYDLDDEPFWRGQGLALTGDLTAARQILTEETTTPQHPRTQLLLAQILATLGENAAARDTLSPLLTTTDPALQKHARLLQSEIDINEDKPATGLPAKVDQDDAPTRFLRARALLQSGQLIPAQEMLQSVLTSPQGGERIHQAAQLLQVEALLQLHQATEAQEQLTKFLDASASSPLWVEAFDLLNLAHQEIPTSGTIPEGVLRWISAGNTAQQQPDPPPVLVAATAEFRGHAIYLTAQWLTAQKRDDEAVSLLEALIQLYPTHPRLSDAMQLAMEIYANHHIDERVKALAEAWHQQFHTASVPVDFAVGGFLYRRGEPLEALQMFQNAANIATTLTERRRALFNAAVSAIAASDFTLYNTLLAQLELISNAAAVGPESTDSAAMLELEKALFLAATHKPEAEDALRTFIRTYPKHPRFADACIALAEWFLLATPPRIEDALKSLDNATTAPGEVLPLQQQRIQYTRLWLSDAAGDLKTLITQGTDFLKHWPKSNLVPEVRMKIAGAYYRLEDFANARTEFEIIARDYPDSQQADTALYFAAMSATSVMSEDGRKRAIEIWEELAQKNGPLAVAARRQHALSERLQGNHAAALLLLDKVLAMKALEPEQRLMTLCEKAELLLLLGKTDPAQLDAAADLLDAFLIDHSLPFVWKARAGFTLATVHHDARHDTEALEACYNVLRAADMTPPTSPADYIWFAKAGFFGVDLLEASRQWEAAARLAEQIAQRPGDRATEAHDRATKIRLEHFLWDGPAPKLPTVLKLNDTPEKAPAKSTKKKGK
ncbi:MAG: outer membrane protein assembly factor BamD [Prosthecobacter sp.]|uniref:outer membrane protein assembly factor BamD n=1 Tax=Prosthecobacter sp. TaxID=1965333 RepID=UPI00262DE7A8|nr:outer membrane protein assembly factor BamD [Prosthecobacter sp.]MCF7789851.1 outer membrane protein assembly factor BamD [Prosthecobacter sp.]